jgi:hypothetical protein
MNVTFLVRDMLDDARSKLERRPVKVATEMKKTRFPGSDDFLLEPVTDTDRESPAYKAWKAGRSFGTPIEKILGKPLGDGEVTAEVIDEIKAAGCTTVEHLAHVPDSAKGIPLLNTMRRIAQDALAAARDDEAAQVVARREEDFQSMKAQLEELKAQNEKLLALLRPPEVALKSGGVPDVTA